jgi:hypothetical protein
MRFRTLLRLAASACLLFAASAAMAQNYRAAAPEI